MAIHEPMAKKPLKQKEQRIKVFKFSFTLKDILLWVLLSIVVMAMFISFGNTRSNTSEKSLSDVFADIQAGTIEKMEVEDTRLVLTYRNGEEFVAYKEPHASVYEILDAAGVSVQNVDIEVVDTTPAAAMWGFLGNLIPSLLFIGFLFFLFRQARGAQDSLFSFGRSTARLYNKHM